MREETAGRIARGLERIAKALEAIEKRGRTRRRKGNNGLLRVL